MRRVGIREFRDQATTILSSGETLVIERHGEPVGFFVPIRAKDRAAGRVALGRLAEFVDALLDRYGLTEDELVDEVAGEWRPPR